MRSSKPLTRGLVFLFVLVGVCSGLPLGQPSPVLAADTGGYPYAHLPCVHAPYLTIGTCANYDWGLIRGTASARSIYSPYGYSYRNCTDYAAWRLRTAGVADHLVRGLGNAKDWAVRARAKGVSVDSNPTVGSVAIRTSGRWGHVGYVVGVYGGHITVAQYNQAGTGAFSVTTGTPTGLGFSEFAHFGAETPSIPLFTTPIIQPAVPQVQPAAASPAPTPTPVPKIDPIKQAMEACIANPASCQNPSGTKVVLRKAKPQSP